ncbi:MAG: putative metal-binding motif-containing protein [Clostridia bacterium]|nr:putative metal-binding motif-containing protein [Deltaproteobacteria bacterium]
MRDLRTFVLASLCVMTACSSSDESHVHLDFQPIRNSARAVGQRVDAGVVLMSTAETTITSNVDIDTWQFAIDLNVGDEVRFEAATCVGASGTCVTNYWGAASAILELTETPVVVNVYPAGELVLNLKRFDGLPVPAGVELELSGANPRGGFTTFKARAGETHKLPIDTYTASVSVDDGLALGIDPRTSAIAMTHGAVLDATIYFGACTGSEDPDGDGITCSTDCDESSAACGSDCGDRDNDSIPDCRDTCIDNDRDGYGVGRACAGADCDDTRAEVAPDQQELCDMLDNDCNPATTETAACEITPDPCEETTTSTLQLRPRSVCTVPL